MQPKAGQNTDRPALAMKIDNIDLGRPQAGIDQADVVFEETVEGGLTRLFAVFQCNAASDVGPVRSARTSDSAMLRLLGHPVFGFSGANTKVTGQVAAQSHAVLFSYDANATLFHRASDRPIPHNVFTSTKTLLDAAKKKDKTLKAPSPIFSYDSSAPNGAKSAKNIALTWSTFTSAAWAWAGSHYVRTQNGTPDVLTDHNRVSAANVVVMRIKTKDTGIKDAIGNPSPDDVLTGSGKVWVFRDGKVVTGKWKRPSLDAPMTFVDNSGAAIKLAPGVTWVELLPKPGTLKF